MIVSGSITLLVGLIVLRRWPFSILFVLGLFLDIDLVIAGATWIGVGRVKPCSLTPRKRSG